MKKIDEESKTAVKEQTKVEMLTRDLNQYEYQLKATKADLYDAEKTVTNLKDTCSQLTGLIIGFKAMIDKEK